MRRLICTFVIRICHKTQFRMTWPIYRVRTTTVLAKLRIQARLRFSTLCTWAGKTPCHEKICLRWFQSVKTQNLTSATVYSSCIRNILSRSRTAKTPFRQRVGWSASLLSIYRLCHDAAQMKIRWYICDTKKEISQFFRKVVKIYKCISDWSICKYTMCHFVLTTILFPIVKMVLKLDTVIL